MSLLKYLDNDGRFACACKAKENLTEGKDVQDKVLKSYHDYMVNGPKYSMITMASKRITEGEFNIDDIDKKYQIVLISLNGKFSDTYHLYEFDKYESMIEVAKDHKLTIAVYGRVTLIV